MGIMGGGFKTAQKYNNLAKKRNSNKDYKVIEKERGGGFSSSTIDWDYSLRTKYGIKLNQQNKDYLYKYYRDNYVYHYSNPCNNLINFKEHTDEENKLIQQELNNYDSNIGQLLYSVDKTHSPHSKRLTKNRKQDRRQKWDSI